MKYKKLFSRSKDVYALTFSVMQCLHGAATPTSPVPLEQAYMQLAQALTADNKQEDALTYYKKTIEYNPKNKEALYQLGVSLFKKNNHAQAISYLEQYTAFDDQNSEILTQLCTAHTKLGNTQKAAYYQEKIVAIHPTEQGYLQLGNLFLQQDNYAQAIESYNRVLTTNSKNSEAYLQKAQALKKSAHLKDALATYDQLLAHYKNHPQALLEKASLLAKMGNTDAAVATYQQLLPMVPAQKKESLLYTLGNTHRKGGNLAQARDLFQNILKQNPNHAHATLGLAKTYISLGDYALGWPLMAQYNQLANPHGARLLTNTNQIKGKKIFIGAEWMLEDMVQLARYAKNIHDAGGSVIMQTPPQLYTLLKTCPFVDTVIGCNENLAPAYHAYIPMTSLPALFGTTLDTVPTHGPYLNPPQELVTQWHMCMQNDNNFKIGLIWKRNETQIYDPAERMSIPFALLAPIAKIPGVSLYCLQTVTEQECAPCDYHSMFTLFGSGFTENTDSLLNLAALMKSLDLVISIDCCAAHIAGALNIPILVLLPTRADYRWQRTGENFPWYPIMQLFRQQTPGNWNSVITDVKKALKKILKNNAP
ncbi:hypothetical protein CVU75_02740 [Candidatus Dependentiae bacterium HGW-Dependentiae-1]|nr:MAG: hypothetical protein CVU75_02740 [Candidatus Dependentiae bacterium HGW-Dependentiae-1]